MQRRAMGWSMCAAALLCAVPMGCTATPSDSCATWLECAPVAASVDGVSVFSEGLSEKFGPDGWCWVNPLQASLCTQECSARLDEAASVFTSRGQSVPSACNADAGNPGGSGSSNSTFASTDFTSFPLGVVTVEIPGGTFVGETVQLTEQVEPVDAAYDALSPLYTWVPADRSVAQPITLTFRIAGGLDTVPLLNVDDGSGSFSSFATSIASDAGAQGTAEVRAQIGRTASFFLARQ